ncbi:hypothetical protein HPB50_025509 [Hyalomma asiaticum]|uniref:Uncharacterized protein n=1 Tax=Hyalomma asiaticum TaxID=266040 RepID=A0ACB7SQT2_HYAAI|nr:hypothetical protein HPB50_025509 [Hyalomma asiaticum]
MAATAKKWTTMTFAAKLEVIQCVENGEKKASVTEACLLDIPRGTPSMLLKKAEQNQQSGAQHIRKAAFAKSLHKWFVDARARNIPL